MTAGAYTIKHYGFVMYILRNMLLCLSKAVKVTDSKKRYFLYITNTYCFTIQAQRAMFYKFLRL